MLRNKKMRTILMGVLVVCAMGNTIFAKSLNETAEIFYNNMKIYIDGAEIVPKDANGNTIEPFTMNGTTYLPVRAISNAFGQDVEWDGATQSIYIGKKDQTKPDNYLDRIQYNDFKKGSTSSTIHIINGTLTDYNENIYTNGILLYSSGYSIKDDKDKADSITSFPLNSQYKTLKGKIVLPKKFDLSIGTVSKCRTGSAKILIYGDGKLLFTAPEVSGSFPYEMNIDVTGVNQLSVKLVVEGFGIYVALTDLALYK